MLNWPKITNHFQKLQTQIENLLQEDLHPSDAEIHKQKSNFVVSTDEALIRGLSLGLPEDEDERALIVFSRLSAFFEIGMLCLNPENSQPPQAQPNQAIIVFLYGQFKAISEKNQIQLPHVGPSRVLRSQSENLWKDLFLYPWIKNQNLTSFLIQLDSRYSFVVFSRFAEPWLKLHFEKIYNEILKV